jgi:transcriptional regulator CBF1
MADPVFARDQAPALDDKVTTPNNKRKRPSMENQQGRAAPSFGKEMDFSGTAGDNINLDAEFNALTEHGNTEANTNGSGGAREASDTAAAALSAYNGLTVPQPTEMTFQSQPTAGDHSTFNIADQSPFMDMKQTPQQGAGNTSPSQSTPSSSKPAVGTDEWHRLRRDNHKEVERRRRETINEGINELAKIVPGCEKNKGSILQRAVQFITQLKENEAQNIEKWTLEKLLTEQAIAELSASVDKADAGRAWQECDIYKRACEQNGIVPDDIRNREAEEADES